MIDKFARLEDYQASMSGCQSTELTTQLLLTTQNMPSLMEMDLNEL